MPMHTGINFNMNIHSFIFALADFWQIDGSIVVEKCKSKSIIF
jgi:hypothetical protein